MLTEDGGPHKGLGGKKRGFWSENGFKWWPHKGRSFIR